MYPRSVLGTTRCSLAKMAYLTRDTTKIASESATTEDPIYHTFCIQDLSRTVIDDLSKYSQVNSTCSRKDR